MGQRFYASPHDTITWPNGAVGYRPGGPMDCIGPYAKVTHCPVQGHARRYTVYATGYADTAWSVPACTRIKGRHVGGYIVHKDDGPLFIPSCKPTESQT